MGEVMKSLKNLSRKVGFTDTETNVLLFIILAFITGVGVNLIKESSGHSGFLEFNYKVQDSLFDAASGDAMIDDSIITPQKKIASQHELLDFSKDNKLKTRPGKKLDPGKLININTAGDRDLLKLPGCGSSTVKNIIGYRNKYGQFKKIDDLLKVKGIGLKKFEKLKKLITVN